MRLFLALPLPREVRESLVEIQQGLEHWSLTAPENFHVTLKFLGPRPPEDLPAIRAALQTIRIKSFHLFPGGAGAFPSKGPPSTAWLGFTKLHPHLFQLRKKINDVLLPLGIEPDGRAFHPHITLARRRASWHRADLAAWLKHQAGASAPPWRAGSFLLYESRPGPTASHYLQLDEWPLLPC